MNDCRRARLKRTEWVGCGLVEHQREIVAVLRRLDAIGRGSREIDADLRHQRSAWIESDAHPLDGALADVGRLRNGGRHVREVDHDATRSILRLVDAGGDQSRGSEQADGCRITPLLNADVADSRRWTTQTDCRFDGGWR